MANFVRIGTDRVNLDHISRTHTYNDGTVRVYHDYAVKGEYSEYADYINYTGDAALLLLAFIDEDDEAIDELYPVVNGQPRQSAPAHGNSCIVCGEPATETYNEEWMCETHVKEQRAADDACATMPATAGQEIPVLGVCAECGDTCAPDAYYHPECVEREIAEHDDEYIEPREIVRDTRDFERYR